MDADFSIGELSRRSGVKVPTIRYYEQIGLIGAPARSAGNQRRYFKRQLDQLVFIRHGRDLGLPLEAIRELMSLQGNPDQPCANADHIARQHLCELRSRIARLQRLEKELERIASGCSAQRAGECYVLRSLADHSLCGDEH